MNLKKYTLLTITHLLALVLGFGLGIYMLPILIAPESPTINEVKAASMKSRYTTTFRKNLKGSDFLHWGKGRVTITDRKITFMGTIAPGPDYKIYLVPRFVETEEDFLKIKSNSLQVADIKTFNNFIVSLPANVDLDKYNTVLVWCEAFKEFITAAKYR